MASRVIVLCAVLAGTSVACMNTSQPRSREAVLDRTAPPPSAAAGALAAAPAPAAADDPPAARSAPGVGDVPEVEVVPVPGSRLGRARATVLVRAALERVRSVLFDFPAYPDFMPHYKGADVESKAPDGRTKVLMKIDALGGMIQRWMRVELLPPTVTAARETFEARLVEGDVKAFEARWVLDRVVGGTRLTVESFLDAKLTLPAAFIDSGSAAGVKASILAIKARAEDAR